MAGRSVILAVKNDKNVNFFNSKFKLKRLGSYYDKNFLYITNVNYSIPDVYYPPEEFDKNLSISFILPLRIKDDFLIKFS